MRVFPILQKYRLARVIEMTDTEQQTVSVDATEFQTLEADELIVNNQSVIDERPSTEGVAEEEPIQNNSLTLTSMIRNLGLLGQIPQDYWFPRNTQISLCKALDLSIPSRAYSKQIVRPCRKLAGFSGLCEQHIEQNKIFNTVTLNWSFWEDKLTDHSRLHGPAAMLFLQCLRFQDGQMSAHQAFLFLIYIKPIMTIFQTPEVMAAFGAQNDPQGTFSHPELCKIFRQELPKAMFQMLTNETSFLQVYLVTNPSGYTFTAHQTTLHLYSIWAEMGVLPDLAVWQNISDYRRHSTIKQVQQELF